MKKLKFAVVTAFVSLVAITGVNAQTFKKADKIVEGTVSYSKTKGADATYSFAPTLGYFTSNKMAVGVNAELGRNGSEETTNIGAFGRYYFMCIGKNLCAYTQMSVASNTTRNDSTKSSVFATNVGLGVNYFVTKKVAVTAHVADLVDYTSGNGTSNFSVGFNGFHNPISMTKFGVLVRF